MERLDDWRKSREDNTADLQSWGDTCWLVWNCKIGTPHTQSLAHVEQIAVVYIMYTEVFASDSKTRLFNRAVDRIRSEPQALELLGDRKTIRAFGEPTSNKWSRNRPIALVQRCVRLPLTGLIRFRIDQAPIQTGQALNISICISM